jgi:putative ABC transport system permease protein
MRLTMFSRYVLRALQFRKRRLRLAFAALAIAATLATALFSIYSDIERKMRGEFASDGANLVVAPAGDARTVPISAVAEAERLGAVAAPFLYTVGRLNRQAVVVAGTDFARVARLTGYWRIVGDRQANPGECLAGAAVASHFNLKPGDHAALEGAPCLVRGIVSTGGAEDAQLIVPLVDAAQLAGLPGAASLVEVRVDGARLQAVQSALAGALPGADVRIVHAVAQTEANIILKIRATLFLLTALVLTITALCVGSNFSALVLERTHDIGILKAIGAAETKIAALFLSESAILGLASAVTGYLLGLFAAAAIGRQIFPGSSAVGVDYRVFLPVTGVTLAVAAAATLAAVTHIWRIQPAVTLRGE